MYLLPVPSTQPTSPVHSARAIAVRCFPKRDKKSYPKLLVPARQLEGCSTLIPTPFEGMGSRHAAGSY